MHSFVSYTTDYIRYFIIKKLLDHSKSPTFKNLVSAIKCTFRNVKKAEKSIYKMSDNNRFLLLFKKEK